MSLKMTLKPLRPLERRLLGMFVSSVSSVTYLMATTTCRKTLA